MNQNDPTGIYTAASKGYADAWEAARRAAMPSGVSGDPGVPTVDREARNRYLANQVKWDAIKCCWGSVEFQARVQDGQSTLMLEPGGTVPDGILTLVTSKEFFKKGKFPIQGDEILVQLPPPISNWSHWFITSVAGQHDTTDASLLLVLEPQDAEDEQQ
jgi:hypothetical protein